MYVPKNRQSCTDREKFKSQKINDINKQKRRNKLPISVRKSEVI